jgi:hypothetical protein
MRAFHRISGRWAIAHGSPDRLSLLRQIRRARGINGRCRTGDRKDLFALDSAAAPLATGAVDRLRADEGIGGQTAVGAVEQAAALQSL